MNRTMRRVGMMMIAAAAMLSCRGDNQVATPTLGSLNVAVTGLASGQSAAITVTGPGNYSATVTSTVLLSNLVPGTYHLTVSPVTASGTDLIGTPPAQDVVVAAGSEVTVTVAYAPSGTGSLAITVSGLPSNSTPHLTVVGPDSTVTLSGNAQLIALRSGTYTILADPYVSGTVTYQPSPAAQTVTVAGVQLNVTIQYVVPTSALTINVDGVYINQAAQRYDFTVPLVKDRPGLLRVFLRANQVNTAAPDVRVRFFQSGFVLRTDTIRAHHAGVPQSIAEGDTTASWNLALPAFLLEPGVQLLVDVDPGQQLSLATRTGLDYPANGVPVTLDVRTGANYNLMLVPIFNTADNQTGNVTATNDSAFMRAVQLLHPMWTYTLALHPAMTFSGGAFQPSDQNGAFVAALQQLETLRLVESNNAYYYGVVHLSYSNGQVGLGYINTSPSGARSAMGWDALGADPLNDASETYAHELAHNMGLFHAPCGGATSPDPNYPHANGAIGVYGYNVATSTVVSLLHYDMMAYCTPVWISDYSLERLITLAPTLGAFRSLRAPIQPVAVITGTIKDGVPTIDPVLSVVAAPELPPATGAWRLRGYGSDGSTLFDLRFDPVAVADVTPGLSHFAFAVPIDTLNPPERVEVLGPAGATRAAPAPTLSTGSDVPVLARIGASTLQLSWRTSRYPRVMVRDESTGDVIGIGDNGAMVLHTNAVTFRVTASDGVHSTDWLLRP